MKFRKFDWKEIEKKVRTTKEFYLKTGLITFMPIALIYAD